MYFSELSGDQRRTYIDTTQAYETYREACDDARDYAGTMHWRTVGGQEYLYHRFTRRARSLGPRNAETEAQYREFTEGKVTATERVAALKERLKVQGAMARATRIDRVPPIAAKLLQAVNDESALKDKVMVVGTNALWAYEALAGVQFETDVVATKDMDIMWDAGFGIELAGPLAGKGLMGFLKGIDRTFQRQRRMRFRATNNDGYAVDLLAPERRGERQLRLVANKEELVAQQIWALNELLETPPVTQVVIGHLGHVVTEMRVPDPRAFVRHKLGLSRRTDRGGKQQRDAMMAEAVARVVLEHLPQFPMTEGDLKGFAAPVRRELEAIA
jgi:hypothetical protein